MAKAPAATASTAPAAALPFEISFGEAPPATVRKVGVDSSPYTANVRALPPVQGDKVASFFVPVGTPPDTITDEGEKAKWRTEDARKTTNRISGLTRRMSKKDPSLAFALRTREEKGVLGVRVYRVNPATPPVAA
jgi:hypothetical protein